MCVRPRPEMRRAASAKAAPRSQEDISSAETNPAIAALQARQVRDRYSIGYCCSYSLAPLVWEAAR